MLEDEVKARINRKDQTFILKHKKRNLQIDGNSANQTLCEALGLGESGPYETIGLVLEYLSVPLYRMSPPWVLHIKTLVGRGMEIEITNPQASYNLNCACIQYKAIEHFVARTLPATKSVLISMLHTVQS